MNRSLGLLGLAFVMLLAMGGPLWMRFLCGVNVAIWAANVSLDYEIARARRRGRA